MNYPMLSEEDKAAARAILASPSSASAPPPRQQSTTRTRAENGTATSSSDDFVTTTTSENTANTTTSSGITHSYGTLSSPATSSRLSTSTPLEGRVAEGPLTRRELDTLYYLHPLCEFLDTINEYNRTLVHATAMTAAAIDAWKPPDGGVADGAVTNEELYALYLNQIHQDALDEYNRGMVRMRAMIDATRLEFEAAVAIDASEEARVSAEGLEAAEVEAGAAEDAARKAWDEAVRKHEAAMEAVRIGRRKVDVMDWNATRLRQEEEAACGDVQSTAVAASNALARKREAEYKDFATNKDKLKPFFESMGHRSMPSVDLCPEYVKDCTSEERSIGEGDSR